MAIASRIDTFTAPTITQANLYDGIKSALLNSGYTNFFDEFTAGSDRVLVVSILLDSTKTYGTTFLRIRVTTALVVGQQIYATWNTTSKTGTQGSSETTYNALVNNAQVNFTALNGATEYKLVVLTQGTATIVLGFIAPSNKPVWWDLNAWNYCFYPTSSTFAVLRTTLLNPYANADHDSSLNVSRMGLANVQTNRRDLLPGIIFYTQSNQGISGRSSDDLVMIAASGSSRYDTIQIPGDTKQYLLLNPSSGGLALRTS